IRDFHVTGVQTCALPILPGALHAYVPQIPDFVRNSDLSNCFQCAARDVTGQLIDQVRPMAPFVYGGLRPLLCNLYGARSYYEVMVRTLIILNVIDGTNTMSIKLE